MVRRVVWTVKARFEFIDILEYWVFRNKSNTFSIKLNRLVREQMKLVSEFPGIGRPTDIPGLFIKVIQNYLIYYQFDDDAIYILTIRHTSQNPSVTD